MQLEDTFHNQHQPGLINISLKLMTCLYIIPLTINDLRHYYS
ncbi:hypothetical protein SynA1528_00092 [Synechococcus sp. A15-28]|nr:hypothetical protein SynA1528_00092 [Synechococcus sp. A15-28]